MEKLSLKAQTAQTKLLDNTLLLLLFLITLIHAAIADVKMPKATW